MAITCTTCEGTGTYYLHNNKQKDCENCNTHGLIEPAEDISAKLNELYNTLEKEITRLDRYKTNIENTLNRLETMSDNLAEVLQTLSDN